MTRDSRAMLMVLLLSACRDAPAPPPVQSPAPAPSAPAVTRPAEASPPSPPTAPAGLTVPFESEGACPFECCVYRTWTVERATEVRAARQKTAPVAFALKAGEKVEALTGVVVVSRPGRARVSRDATIEGLGALKAGDEVAVLHPLGEGFWLVWNGGKKGSGQVGEKPARPGPWEPELNPIEMPDFTWWVHVRDGAGRTGWTDAPENFGDKDSCA